MKRLVFNFLIILFLNVFSNQLLANKRDEVERKKKIKKTYIVNSQQVLDITNKFGKVHINTWDKDQIDIVIEIVALGETDERAMRILDKIEIDITESTSRIQFETLLKGNMSNGKEESFEINYEVSRPKTNPLKFNNSFGDTYLADFAGNLEMDVSYGGMQAGKLTGSSNVKVSFGDGNIDEIKGGDLIVKYSDVDVEELGNVKLDLGYSDVSVGKGNNLLVECKYGDFDLGEVYEIKGSVGFSGFKIAKLYKSIVMEAAYAGGFRIEEVAKDFEIIDLKGKLGVFRIGLSDQTNCSFEAKLKFCELNYSGLNLDLNYKVKEDFKSEYRGKIGDGSGGKISITSEYGDVKLHN
jgi:hypothetical protein